MAWAAISEVFDYMEQITNFTARRSYRMIRM